MRLGERIVAMREAMGLSQNQLSERAEVPQPTLQRIEKGTTPNPGINYVRAIASALGCTIDQLVDGAPHPAFSDAPTPPAARPRSIAVRLETLERADRQTKTDLLDALKTAREALALAIQLRDAQSSRSKKRGAA
jgi:transcriptional regulator with XRE-family HTH domain